MTVKPNLEVYVPIVGQSVIDDLKLLGEKLKDKTVEHVNSTAVGGGVAEILNRMVPLLNELGVSTRWSVIKGGSEFYAVTKKFHNVLHGKQDEVTKKDYEIFRANSEMNIRQMNLTADITYIHDPQPIALIKKKSKNRWIWRCHIDVSSPHPGVWNFLQEYIAGYDASVFSAPSFVRELPIRQFLVAPSIDPLSAKNCDLPEETVRGVMEKYNIAPDKPVITQISRFDRLKDPVGVVETYRLVKKYNDCQLILAGGVASDDPEGLEVLEEVKARVGNDPDVHILLLPQDDVEINALQRASTIIMQKSLKEGFGLTVAEALWKGKPVVASNVGGIPLQVSHKHSGLLCHSVEGAAFAVKQLLNSPQYAQRLGENGREHIRNNFLLTRHLRDYMLLFLSLFHPAEEDIVYL